MRSIGRYEIVREIGRGGTATVYLARQTELERLVALKELSTFWSGDPAMAQRFLRESRLTGALNHPNIVTVHEYFVESDVPYIAMEYVTGGSLRPYVGQLSFAQLAGVLEGVLAGLSHAESRAIVHRDLKPENLLLTEDGRVKIADFGIAKATMTAAAEGNDFLTSEGTTVGTPTYMAPEQAMGQNVGIWTDLYSLGVIAWEQIVGHPPFEDADQPMVILVRHVNDGIPSANTVNPKADPDLSAWIDRLLVKDPAARAQSATAAWDELEEIVISKLGPRWRREARLRAATPEISGPLTPAPFEANPYESLPVLSAPGASAPEADGGYETFVTYPRVEAADPEAAPSADEPPSEPTREPAANSRSESQSRVPRDQSRAPPVGGPPLREVTELPAPVPFESELVESFRYLHGPLVRDEFGMKLLGNGDVLVALKDRLLHSQGGAFLVTGFRGVGKTTVVLRALEEVQQTDSSSLEYLPVVLSVARPMTTDQLLFEVVRRLFEALIDRGVLEAIEPATKDALLLAYARTSLAFKETSSRARENSQSINMDLSRIGGPAMALAPTIGVSRKRTDSLAREASFLAYSQSDVEHDFLRIIDLLNKPVAMAARRRFGRSGRVRRRWRGKLVVVLDELDKLTATDEGQHAVDELLMSLKNILTARNVHFIFVGGPELHDAFVRDVASGNGVYESVFACHIYVPCVWDSSARLLEAILAEGAPGERSQLEWYFNFKARGIPRLLVRELNDLVHWRGDRAVMQIDGLDADRLAFYAHVQSVVNRFLHTAIDDDLLALPIDADRWRLGAYYVTDWILRRGKSAFTIQDLLDELPALSPLMRASGERAEMLVKHLVAHSIVDELWASGANNTIIQDADQVSVYRLAQAVIAKLASFARGSESERVGLQAPMVGEPGIVPSAAAVPWARTDEPTLLDGGRYEVRDLIGVGGAGRVYRAWDRRLNRAVAIKVPSPQLVRDDHARGRWRREADIATRLTHPNIVRTFDVFEESAERVGIVMELIEGPSLRSVLPLRAWSALAIVIDLLAALGYAAEAGLARFDLKPENVHIEPGDRPVIVDLGLVKPVEQPTGAFATMASAFGPGQALVGTPAYMSPEQAKGLPLDIRSDLYCLGLLLYECITGDSVRDQQGSSTSVLLQAANEDIELPEFGVSAELREAILRALARDPDDRFESAAAMSSALKATPEAAETSGSSRRHLLRQTRPPRQQQPVAG